MKSPQINITFEEDTVKLLGSLAKKQEKTVSDLVKDLILEALSRREDMELSANKDVYDDF